MTLFSLGMILMTVGILQFTVIPLIADLNYSHAANPAWPGHARFHVVTQVCTSSAIGIIALYCLWSGRFPSAIGICLAMMLALAVLGSFFLSAVGARHYGGSVAAGEGLAAVRLGMIDGNVANFSTAAIVLIVGRLIV